MFSRDHTNSHVQGITVDFMGLTLNYWHIHVLCERVKLCPYEYSLVVKAIRTKVSYASSFLSCDKHHRSLRPLSDFVVVKPLSARMYVELSLEPMDHSGITI